MIPIKTKDEIKRMKEGGKRLAWVMAKALGQVKSGVRLSKLDKLAESLIEKQKGKPSFKMVKNYHWATCINVNQGVVHGIPNEYRLKKGDLVSLDMGFFYKGLHTDAAKTVLVGKNLPNRETIVVSIGRFLETGEKALKEAVKAVRPGNRVGHISQAIQEAIKKSGFNSIKALTGHGVGKKLHEEPQIPCYLEGAIEKTPNLEAGMTLAIEIIYTQGKPDVVLDPDGWTVRTADGKPAGLFEETVSVTDRGGEVLTN